MIVEQRVSHRQACNAVRISSSTQRYKKKKGKDEPLIMLLQDLVEMYPAIGFWQCYFRIRRMGHLWNHKRLYSVIQPCALTSVGEKRSGFQHALNNLFSILNNPIPCGA
jgi:hypothetical protein